MVRVRQRVKALTGSSRPGARDVRELIADVNPVLRGGGSTACQGPSATRNPVDCSSEDHR